MTGLKRPTMDAIFYHTSVILLSTIYYIFVTKIFVLFVFNVENKVELMRVNERRVLLVS